MEWVAAAMRDFLRDPTVRTALQMIDWNERRVLLFPDHPEEARRYVRVDDRVVARALLPHAPGHKFSAVEAAIRDTFDHFLDQLALIHSFVREGLVTAEQVRSYLEYWISNIGDPDRNPGPAARLRALHTYIEVYGFDEVKALFEVFNYPLKTQPREEQDSLRALDGDALVRSLNDPTLLPSGVPSAAGGDAEG